MVRLKDIAEHVGVSISTVSRVIQNDQTRNVNPETRAKVWEAVKELGYTPNQHARNLVTNQQQKGSVRTMKVGWVANPQFADINPYFADIYTGIVDELSAEGYTLVSITKDELENETLLLKIIHDSGIEGLLLVDEIEQSITDYIRQYIPLVGLDFYYSSRNMAVVDFDREGSMKKVVEYFVSEGHRKIGFAGGGVGKDSEHLEKEPRFQGYKIAMAEAGLEIRPEWVLNTKWKMDISYEKMKSLIGEGREKNELPTAMVCASDMMAIAAMRAAIEFKLEIPGDIAFFGVDNIEMAKYSSPQLSSVDIPKFELGRMAAKTIIDMVEGKITLPVKTILPAELVIRESSGIKRTS